MSWRRRGALAVLLLTAAAPLAAQQSRPPIRTTELEFWPGAELYVPLVPQVRAMGSVGASTDYESSYTEMQVSGYADVAFVGDFAAGPPGVRTRPPWYVRVGYRFADRLAASELDVVEHRLTAEATVRSWIGGAVLVSFRAGADYRMVEQGNAWRMRGRVRGDVPARIGTVTMTPYGSVEPTWDSVDDDIARYRFQLGSEVVLAHGFTLNAYYAYQLDRFSATSNVHGIGAILMMYL